MATVDQLPTRRHNLLGIMIPLQAGRHRRLRGRMTHEFDGKRYEKASFHQREWGTKLIAELGLLGDEYVLDLGCGDGTLTAQLAELLPQGRALGIDASQGMIDAARPKAGDRLRFLVMDIDDLDFTECFDVVYSNATLHWVKDHTRLLRNVRRALRPGGRLRFNFAGDGNCSNFFAVIRKAMACAEFRRSFEGFAWPWYMPTVAEYQILGESSGLHHFRVWGENADRFFPDETAMVPWLDQPSLVPFLPCLPERHREAFRGFVVDEMVRRTKQVDGRCFETFRRINVSARR
jgi:trans-aconitate 2-methyltransferase